MSALGTDTLAAAFGVKPATIRAWCYLGLIGHHRRGGRTSRFRFTEKHIAEFLESRFGRRYQTRTQQTEGRRTATRGARAFSTIPTPTRVPDPLDPTD